MHQQNDIPAIRVQSLKKVYSENFYSNLKNIIALIRNKGFKKAYSERKNKTVGLHDCSFEIECGQLVAVLGPSGCGKSTLLKALNGDSPQTSGKVFLSGFELNEENIDFIKPSIGYVPQDDIIHTELTVEKTLMYAANLRLIDMTHKERRSKVASVIETLKIENIRSHRVAKISGGQRKRVAIAMEILTSPKILFLDEPTSPLDPQTIKEFLLILKELTKKGTTVIMVTHKPEDLYFMDKAIFMSRGGRITYYGSANSYLDYFKVENAIEVYALLDSEKSKGYWIQKYEYLNPTPVYKPFTCVKPTFSQPNYVYQYFWLSLRYLNIKLNDYVNFFIMIAQAPIIAILLCIIFDSISQVVPFFIAVSAIWFGANNAAREIVCEQKIYKRERMFNLGIFSYIFSKVTVLGIIAIIQSSLFTLILYYRYKAGFIPGYSGLQLINPAGVISWMTFLTLASTLMGLMISSMVDSTEKVMSIIPIILIPQIMLAGIVVKIKFIWVELLSYMTLSRWGSTGFAKVQENISIPKPIIKPGTGLGDLNFNPPIAIISEKEDSTVNAISAMSDNFLSTSSGAFEVYKDSISLEIFIITGISIIFFIALFFSMQSKDSITIKN
jgi:ABC-type multidrug transport system ATPase subunit